MTTIYTYTRSLIETIRKSARYSTSGIYSSAVNSFLRFAGNSKLPFHAVSPEMIKQYEEHLLQQGRRHNTVSTYMRMLRSIFNQAEEQGISLSYTTDDLFRFVFTGYESTAKRAISPTQILQKRMAVLP